MVTTGIVRRIDELGRIVIPKEIRRTLGIKEGATLEILVEKDVVILRKHSTMNNLQQLAEMYVDSVYASLKKDVLITDRDNIIAASGSLRKEYLGKPISKSIMEVVKNSDKLIEKEKTEIEIIEGKTDYLGYVINTIISNGDLIGLIIILSNDGKLGDLEEKTVMIAAQFFGKHVEV